MIKEYCKNHANDEVLTVRGVGYTPNSGKGNAVRMGFLYSKGRSMLMMDADAATELADYERLESRVDCHKDE